MNKTPKCFQLKFRAFRERITAVEPGCGLRLSSPSVAQVRALDTENACQQSLITLLLANLVALSWDTLF